MGVPYQQSHKKPSHSAKPRPAKPPGCLTRPHSAKPRPANGWTIENTALQPSNHLSWPVSWITARLSDFQEFERKTLLRRLCLSVMAHWRRGWTKDNTPRQCTVSGKWEWQKNSHCSTPCLRFPSCTRDRFWPSRFLSPIALNMTRLTSVSYQICCQLCIAGHIIIGLPQPKKWSSTSYEEFVIRP